MLHSKNAVLEGFGYIPGTDAAGAHFDGLDTAVIDSFDLLKVRVPDGSSFVVCVTYIVTEAGPFSTDFTSSRHSMFPPIGY